MSVTNDPGQTTWCLGACMYMDMRVSETDKNMRVSEWNQFCYKCYLPLSEAYSLTSHRCPVPKRHGGPKNEKVLRGTTFMAESLYLQTSNFTGRCIRLRSETCFLSRETERGKCSYFVTIFILYSIIGSTPTCHMGLWCVLWQSCQSFDQIFQKWLTDM